LAVYSYAARGAASRPRPSDVHARLFTYGLILAACSSLGANYYTPNFSVQAPTAEAAKLVAEAAEYYRSHLAQEWLGAVLPPWTGACIVEVEVGEMAPGGATTFVFHGGQVYNWRMVVRGPLQQILDCVLPHEVNHAVFASHFRRPVPRWADEGAATLTEDVAQQLRQRLQVDELLRRQTHMTLRELLGMQEYPSRVQDCATLYAEGFSLCDFLVQTRNKVDYIRFLKDAQSVGWDAAVRRVYGYRNIESLEESWQSWVKAGSHPIVQNANPQRQFAAMPLAPWW
jgi:hypothetical protein